MDDRVVVPRSLRGVRIAAGLSVFIPIAAGFLLLMWSLSSQSPPSIGDIGLDYAKNSMAWITGPTLKGVYPTTLSRLQGTLNAHVPVKTVNHINVPDLQRRFGQKGRDPRVDVVVLTGTFNSLPPDEGIVGPGTVIVLVDPVNRRPFYVND